MPQVPIERYFEKLRKSDPKYHWPFEREKEGRSKRQKIHKDFPYVVTYSGNYGPGWLLDDMQDWCRDQFGDSDGECHWRGCKQSWDYWYKGTGLEDELEDALYARGPRPKNKKMLKKWEKIGDKLIDDHFMIIESRTDSPSDDHSHIGIWAHHFVCKIGYDEGYEDYCFKNPEDAIYFKIMWEEEAERRA